MELHHRCALAALAPLLLAAPGSARPQCQEGRFFPAQGVSGDLFGTYLAVDGELCLVGAQQSDLAGDDRGAAHLFARSGGAWIELAALVASDGVDDDRFGTDVALWAGTALASSTRHDGYRGAVYVYDGTAGWQEAAILTASDAQPDSSFGTALALDGTTAFVGAQGDDEIGTQAGSVYVFERGPGGWTEVDELFPSDAAADWNFGSALALDGERLLVGALLADGILPATGAAYVFELRSGAWVQVAKLAPSGAAANDLFGATLALDGDRALVGAPVGDAVYAFELVGGAWVETQKIAPPDAAPLFGSGVALDGALAAIGSPSDAEAAGSAGALYLYGLEGGVWQWKAKLFAEDASTLDRLGQSVALAGEQVLAGAVLADGAVGGAGAVYVFSTLAAEIGTYCVAAPNSAGPGATMGWEGSASIADDDFALAVTGGPPGQPAFFFYGAAPTQAPFGDGFRCVAAPIFRLRPPIALDAQGAALRPIAFTEPPASGGPGEIEPGSTWYAQCWYRDPAAGGSTFNLSNGLRASSCP